MTFNSGKELLYLEMDVLGVSLGAGLLHVRDGMQFPRNEAPDNAALWSIAFMNKSLTCAETCYGNTERVALGILHCLNKFHHYCFSHEVSMITDHKSLVAIFKKDGGSLSYRW